LPKKGALAAERGKPRDRVGAGAARHFDRLPHAAVKFVGAIRVDQRHRALFDSVGDKEMVVRIGDHIDKRVADAGDVIFQFGHGPHRR